MNGSSLAGIAFVLAVNSSLFAFAAGQNTPESGSVENVNAAVVAARTATKDQHFADAETLMLKVTASQPDLVVPWAELGLAQLGLKKYAEAESDFKIALGIDPAAIKRQHAEDFYQDVSGKGVAPSATRATGNNVGHTINSGQKRPPELQGSCYASLGEAYIRQGKIPEAQAAFDSAVKIYPADAAHYLRNETILYFQVGNADAQLAAADKAIALDPGRAILYYFKAQALVGKAILDPKTQKMVLPAGCAEAYQRYLELEPAGEFTADAKGVLTAAGIPLKTAKK
ncbi:MAG TPA: tetratricopeptide repeat protein [Terracidiphilus sp.]|jgi:tetratricopeptide (TPR) repeat protein